MQYFVYKIDYIIQFITMYLSRNGFECDYSAYSVHTTPSHTMHIKLAKYLLKLLFNPRYICTVHIGIV